LDKHGHGVILFTFDICEGQIFMYINIRF